MTVEPPLSHQYPPIPSQCDPLDFHATYSDADFAAIARGFVPTDMDEKWRVDYENDWLYLRRSWTGCYIFWLRLERCPEGARVAESYVSRDRTQYRGIPLTSERELLADLIENLLLRTR
jgi:hypothetical protein